MIFLGLDPNTAVNGVYLPRKRRFMGFFKDAYFPVVTVAAGNAPRPRLLRTSMLEVLGGLYHACKIRVLGRR